MLRFHQHEAEPVRAWEWCGLVACAAALVLLRLPLYTQPGILLGWHSDTALLGLMARALVAGDIPLLFWATDYLAPLTSVFVAAVGVLLDDVGPLALRLGVAIEVFAAILFFHAALRRIAGARAAMLTTAWLVAGPPFLFKLTYAPLSAEAYFFLGAIIFWYGVRAPFDRPHRWLIFGLLAGLGWWIHRGTMLVVLPVLVAIFVYDRRGLPRRDLLIGAAVFTAGAILGIVPKVIGLYGLDQRLYTPIKVEWSFLGVAHRSFETVTYDFWVLIGAETPVLGWVAGALFVVLLASAIRHFRWTRETLIAAGIVLLCLAIWILSTETYRGAVRYIMVAVPILCAFAAAEIIRLWDLGRPAARVAAVLFALTIAAAYYGPARQQTVAVTLAQREDLERWRSSDPRSALKSLSAGGYRVCYADVWVAHKLEWLSGGSTRFIPYRSVNRRMVESLRLASLPGPKCFVDTEGRVRELTPHEEADFRLETLWHMHGWRRNEPIY